MITVELHLHKLPKCILSDGLSTKTSHSIIVFVAVTGTALMVYHVVCHGNTSAELRIAAPLGHCPIVPHAIPRVPPPSQERDMLGGRTGERTVESATAR